MSTEAQLKQRISQLEDEVTSLKLKSEREKLHTELKDLIISHDTLSKALDHAQIALKSIEKAHEVLSRGYTPPKKHETIKSLHDFLNYYTPMCNSIPNKIDDIERKLVENDSKLQEITERQENQD